MQETLASEFALEGRVAVVTGAASGIGRGTAAVLAEAGATVILADLDEAGLAGTAAAIGAAGGNAAIRRTDVTDRAAVQALARHALDAHGRLDVWVNAAGILTYQPIEEATEEDFARITAVNMRGVYWGCAAAFSAMRQHRRGAIVNISSTGADAAAPGLSLYGMTKAAVNMITRSAAVEFGPHGIRVNAVAPGFVETPMVAYRFRDAAGGIDEARREAVLAERARGSPLGITGTPRDIALAILYLASDASRVVTGQVLRPNGGVSMP